MSHTNVFEHVDHLTWSELCALSVGDLYEVEFIFGIRGSLRYQTAASLLSYGLLRTLVSTHRDWQPGLSAVVTEEPNFCSGRREECPDLTSRSGWNGNQTV